MQRCPAEPKPALTAESAANGHVGVGQDQHVILRAAECLNALAVVRGGVVDVARDRGRADETHRRNVGMLEQALDRDAVAVHDAEYAGRKSRFAPERRHHHRCGRVLLRRFEDECIPGRDRDRVHPHRHHDREVERRDAGNDAEWLADRIAVDA
jgi:hypothetical protein